MNAGVRLNLITLALVSLPFFARCADADETKVSYRQSVLPILSDRCFICHGPDSASREAGLRLDRRDSSTAALDSSATAIVPGQPEQSELVKRIMSNDSDEKMPPPDSGKSLSSAEQTLLREWIKQGAVYEKHWAFVAPVRPAVPQVKRQDLVRNPIDSFVLARLEAEHLEPASRATRERLMRRLYFDLIGLPPSVEEIDRFLADRRPDAYEKLVDRLLQSPHYGERMATDWLDGARFADSNGYQNDFSRDMSPWRDWVIGAFNKHMRYDQFIIEQIAGDLLPNATLSQRIATGFNRNHRTVTENGSIEEEWLVENVVDRVETTATVILGLTAGCARCHDHKFDPITQTDFYQLFAFFNNVDEKGVYTQTRGNVPPVVKAVTLEHEERLAEFDAKLRSFEKQLSDHPADVESEGQVAEKRQKLRLELESAQEQRAKYHAAIPTAMVMEERANPRVTYLLRRGRYDQPDESQQLQPNVPAVLPPLPADAPRNRLGLARWLVSPENPLVARVVVNRLWQQHFGIGLVKSVDNLGVQSEPPSHPELLDWLATELICSSWDLQHIQRLIVTSNTYQQRSEVSTTMYVRDPDNRLLARGPRYRLQAEAIRDNALSLSGLLVKKIGGPSVMPYQPAGLWEELASGESDHYVQGHGEDLYRRSLYTYRKRTVPHPSMATFDAPSWEICQASRARTNTPLQALAMLNDVTYMESSRKLAERMLIEGGNSDLSRLTFAFRLAVGRTPNDDELALLGASVKKYAAWFRQSPAAAEDYLRHGEAPLNESLDPVDLAAHAAVASIILNMDEAISKN